MKISIRQLFNRHLNIKVFNKLLTLYSVVIVISLFALTFFVSYNINSSTINTELDTNRKILDSVNNYLLNKNTVASNIFYQFYSNGDTLNDLDWYFKYNYDEYLKKRLDKYYSSPSFEFNDTETNIRYNFNTDPDIESIVLYSSIKKTYSVFHSSNKYSLYHSRAEYLYDSTHKYVDNPQNNLFTNKKQSRKLINVNLPYSISHVFRDPETKEILGSMIVNYSSPTIRNSYLKYRHQLLGYILVLSQDGSIIFDSSKHHYGKYKYFKLLKNKKIPEILASKNYVDVNTSNPNATIIGIISKRTVLGKSVPLLKTVTLIAFFLIFAAIIFMIWALRSYSRRTERIVSTMQELKNGNLTARIPVTEKKQDELTMISKQFNKMCTDLSSYINKVYLLELKQKDAELIALQAQVNPHFLYNTLESIRMRAVSQGCDDVGNMLYILATFFRNSIKKKMIISISEELNNCGLYLELFKIRYENKLNYSIEVDPLARGYSIIKLTVQPIIENFIVHGIDFKRTDNFISVKTFLQDNTICIVVSDNGKGIKQDVLENILDSLNDPGHNVTDSIGIINVNERIKHKYGKEYGLEITSQESIGTCVTIRLPQTKV